MANRAICRFHRKSGEDVGGGGQRLSIRPDFHIHGVPLSPSGTTVRRMTMNSPTVTASKLPQLLAECRVDAPGQ